MNSGTGEHDQRHLESVSLYALGALPSSEIPAVEAHLSACADCRYEMETFRPVVGAFVSWPTDVLRPPPSLWDRLAASIARETSTAPLPSLPPRPQPEWDQVAPGIFCKVLAADSERNRVSMLVRLAPGTAYPSHRHAGLEELHLLDGVLKVDDTTLHPGDYIRAEAGSLDRRVWSETGCTCVLITSPGDVLL